MGQPKIYKTLEEANTNEYDWYHVVTENEVHSFRLLDDASQDLEDCLYDCEKHNIKQSFTPYISFNH